MQKICIYPGNRPHFQVLIITQLVKKFLTFIDPKYLLPSVQKLSAGPHSDTDEANHCPHTLFL
jgi:hypothetical protein